VGRREVIHSRLEGLDSLVEPMLQAARIPGAALAVVAGEQTLLARGYGWRDLEGALPMTAETVYPIASTTKGLNATLLGMLVDEGLLAWDTPVREYLPELQLSDSDTTAATTLRDLLSLRTGMPRHDFLWTESGLSRAGLVERMPHLPLSARLRERFQYTNLTPTLAGHIAEVVTGRSWEDLMNERLLKPLGMHSTTFAAPRAGNTTASYHENQRRDLVRTVRWATEPIGPAGGSLHSTIADMARWLAFNLNGGESAGRQLLRRQTLHELHSACVLVGTDPSAPSPNAAYGLGWFIDRYNGYARISHSGYLHDVHGWVMLFPEVALGIVSFTNFASSRLASLISQCTFDLLMGLEPLEKLEQRLARYEQNIADTRRRLAGVHRVPDTSPSHPLQDYAGSYAHPGYGRVEIVRNHETLRFQRNQLILPLQHWHYDAWVVADNELFEIHRPHAFERSNRICFETSEDGAIEAFRMRLEPAIAPIRFVKHQDSRAA
jgi:CubicO group peptidase (beta-lactamase class C family)